MDSSRAAVLFLAGMLAVLAGCSPGPGVEGTTPTPTPPGKPSIALALTNAAGAAVTSISVDAPATVSATVKDANGAVVANTVVTFSTDTTLAVVSPTTTALTNAVGVATVTLKPATNQAVGATTLTAAAQAGSAAATGAISFSIESTGTPGNPTDKPTLSLALTNAAGASVTSISIGAPATVSATLRDVGGAAVANTVVTFSTDPALASISPAATALTDVNGVAKVTLNPATIQTAGASTISATAQVGGTSVSGSTGFSIGVAAVAVSAPVLGVGSGALSAYGTTSIAVTVSINGVPVSTQQSVTFSSSCASVGKAILTTAVATVNGVATGSYRDNGCAGTDVITASAAGATSPSTNLVVSPPTTGSIQFVSATPSIISLKGIGGVEAAQVRFRVLDASGNPLSGKTVTFGLSTTVGGITLTPTAPATAISDANGLVAIGVNSGTVSTPVRVTASTPGPTVGTTLTTQSSALTITTGIPDQDSFSLSADIYNPEFGAIDGNKIILTARLADHFNNPVPNGTVVNFTTEGGSIVASCSTVIDSNGNSNCSTTLSSQEPRPADGRATVLAYAVGEESFIDLNGNGVADLEPYPGTPGITEMVVNGLLTDLSEAFRDDNENGVREANETFLDFNQNGVFDGPDGKYSGVLCDTAKSSPGTCSTNRSIHVRKSVVIVFSGSSAFISKIAPASTIDLGGNCAGASQEVDLRIVDVRGNPMPAGTTVAITTTNGTISGTGTITQPNTNVTPAAGAANYTVSIRDDGVKTTQTDPTTGAITFGPCVDTTISGVLTVTVTTPGSGSVAPTKTVAQFPVIN
jgi:hypothetical protein